MLSPVELFDARQRVEVVVDVVEEFRDL